MIEIEKKIAAIDEELAELKNVEASDYKNLRERQLISNKEELLQAMKNLSPKDKVAIARDKDRPNVSEYIEEMFEEFFELKGDHYFGEDESILAGLAFFHGIAVTVIGQKKGKTLEENLRCNFGMPNPEGYRKALRLMKQAEKFKRPIITLIDTPGAYPGIDAEARGQSEAIARNLAEMSALEVPIIAVIIGEGNSGGALALAVANSVLMLENSIYCILSPEGFASILWKDASRSKEACEIMKLTAQDLLGFGMIDAIIPEPLGGAHRDKKAAIKAAEAVIYQELEKYRALSAAELREQRYHKFRSMGQ